MHFDAKLSRRSGGKTAHDIVQLRVITGLQTTSMVSGIVGKLEECNQHITPVYPRTLYNLSMSLLLYKNSYVWFQRVEVSTNASDLVHGMMVVFLQWCTPHRRTCVVMFVQSYATDLIDKEPCLILIDSDRSCLP